jgi:predicted TIM-barrel fold metal-dependent hydrolase
VRAAVAARAPKGIVVLATLRASVVAGAAALTIACAPADAPTLAAPAPAARASIALMDAHNHIMPGLTPQHMISVLDELGVSKVVLMATGAPQRELQRLNELTRRAHQQYPDRVIPFLALNPVRRVTPALLEYLDRELAGNVYRGMGELLLLHYGFSRTTRLGTSVAAPMVEMEAGSPGAQDLACLAARHNVVLIVHMETTAGTLLAMERLLARSPTTKLIWAHQTPLKTQDGSTPDHARKTDPAQVAALLDRYPNLYADLAPGYERMFLTPADAELPPRWKELYERYSDRFVLGLDMPFLVNWEEREGARRLAQVLRRWLRQLTPEARRRIAQENLDRILAAKPAAVKACHFLTR